MSFKKGDKVYINAPDDWDVWPTWTNEMDEQIDLDRVYTINYITDNGAARLLEIGWTFNQDWLELSEDVTSIVTGPYSHVIKKIRQLDKRFENRHKETEYAF